MWWEMDKNSFKRQRIHRLKKQKFKKKRMPNKHLEWVVAGDVRIQHEERIGPERTMFREHTDESKLSAKNVCVSVCVY